MRHRLWKISAIKLLLPVLLIIYQFTELQAQWIKQSPIPTDKEITDICFISPDTGWIFGFEGTIFRTNDGGENWIDQSLAITNDIEVGLFLDGNLGWIGLYAYYLNGYGEIYRTNDGGYSWEQQFYDETGAIRDLSFLNSDTGWALAYKNDYHPPGHYWNFFLKTIDGGENWIFMDSIPYTHFNRLDFINDNKGYIAGIGTPNLMKSADGGQSWQSSPHASNSGLTDVLFTDETNGYSCGNNFYYTHNAGASWQFTYCYHSYKVGMYDTQNGWTITYDKAYKVSNGGQNLVYQYAFDKSVLADISVVDSSHAMVAGRDVCVYSTIDGGATWQEKSSGAPGNLHSVFFLNENDGWAGGEDHILLITHDGGQHWVFHDLGNDYPVSDIQFISPSTGFLANGYILKSTDSGATWNVTSGYTRPIYDLYFINPETGWSVGDDGRLFISVNGGLDWEGLNSGTTSDLHAVYFINQNSGWIAGNGTVRKTNDGGETWEEKYASDADFLKIRFFDEDVGYVLADRYYLKTYNGGDTWQLIIPDGMTGPYSMEDLCFIDEDIGYISGTHYLLKTMDGGMSWYTDEDLPPMSPDAIFFINESKGWVVGDYGVIYKTETGGGVSIDDPGNEALLSFKIFPNPSAGIVKISYQVESSEEIEIGIYDLQGTKVFGKKENAGKTGSYSFEWDPVDLSSGIYIIKIKTGELSYTGKIVYLK